MTGPTLAQLRAEYYWPREINTPELLGLERRLCEARGRKVTTAGGKGDYRHLSGGHRSQEWLLRSQYATNRTYTVQTGLTGEAVRHIAAFDDIPGSWGTADNRTKVKGATKRLIDAAKAGRLGGVREILGTLDGVTTVRWLVVERRFGTRPDSSHFDHNHLTFDRTRMRDAALMARVADLILGDEMEKTTILSNDHTVNDVLVTTYARIPTNLASVMPAIDLLDAAVTKLTADVARLATGGVDPDELADRIAVRLGLTPDMVRAAVRAELDETKFSASGGGV